MTATPSRGHLWTPSRGISFSSNPPTLASSVPNSPSLTGALAEYAVPPLPVLRGVQSASSSSNPLLREPVEDADSRPAGHAETIDNEVEVTAENTTEATTEATTDAKRDATDEPPPAVLDYKMAEDLFYAAKNAPLGDAKSFWSYTQYRRIGEDGKAQKVVLHYCRNRSTMEEVCQRYFKDEKLLGFDLEWIADSRKTDGVKKNVSVIQLASPSRVALFHLALFADSEDMVGPTFRSIMEDPTVIKAGVAIKGDCTRLRQHTNVDPRGLMELSHLYKLVTYCRTREYRNINRTLVSLARQVEEYLHLPLCKDRTVRSSDWSRPLTWQQVIYSASDAYAAVHLYATLEHYRKQLDPCPPTPHFAELNLAIPLADGMKLTNSDEATETAEVEPPDECSPVTSGASDEYLADALETLSIEDGDAAVPIPVPAEPQTSLMPKGKPQSTAVTAKPSGRPRDSRVEVAEDRATSYRASHPKTSASMPSLRAYYLWHCYDLSPATIAQLLRDPPLKTNTVVQYILSAVQSEKLPVDYDELQELAGHVLPSTLWARWPVVARMISPPGR
ncbi:ribonuclease H-like protein [Xylariaceae sp. FL0594]|nr:ribonuclease H-like protein [Xylariaceae sp. FL0594]